MKRPAPEKWEAPALWLGLALALAAAVAVHLRDTPPWGQATLAAASAAWAALYLAAFPADE